MKKNLLYTVLWFMGLIGTLTIWVVKAEYSQVINITWTNWDIIQSFEQKWEDLEVYFLDDAWKVNHYTMMDRNMWATEIYNWDFSTWWINTWSFWYHYQWGNNYWFAPCIATWESCDTFPNGETTTNTRVPKSVWMLYVPSNYANNKWNRHDPRMESSVENYQNNDNLWWWSWDAGYNHLTWNIIDRRWPCPNWYYVPSISNLRILLGSRNKYSSIKSWNQFASDLLLPPAGNRRYWRWRVENQGKVWVYLSSSPEATKIMWIGSVTCWIRIDKEKAFIKYPNAREDLSLADRGIWRGDWNSVRCFKWIENDNYKIYGNWWTGAVIIIYKDKLITLSNPTNRTLIFVWWYDANEWGKEVKEWDTAPRNLYARWGCDEWYELSEWQCIPKRYKIEYELNWWELAELIEEYTIESDNITLRHPSKSWYTFIWWSGTDINGYTKDVVILAWSIWNRSYEAKWACNLGYLENSDWSNCEKIRVEFDANWWKFNGEFDTTSVWTTIKTISHEETKRLHTINLTDEWKYKRWQSWETMCSSCAPNSWYNESGVLEIHGYSTWFIQIDWVESLNVSIRYGWSSYTDYNPNIWPIWIWTWNHTDYEPRNPNHSGSAVWYLSEFPAYGTCGADEFVVQWNSISIVQAGWYPNYWWYVTVTKEGVYEVVYESWAFDDIPQPIREWHSFKWWYLSDGSEFDTWNVSTWEITKVYAKWECALWYEDKWWECVKKSSWSSGWGGRSKTSNDSQISPDPSLSRGEEDSSLTKEGDREAVEDLDSKTPMDSSDKSSEWQEILSPSDSSFTKEQKDAYKFAHEKWITTMPTIQEAQMDWKLTRIAMAKMLSQYAMNVLWQRPANIVTPKFNDVTDKQNSNYDDWVTLAYQLWIMWQNMPNNKFRPDDEVTRAEFATALSRMLYHTSDWQYKSTDKYYTNHMKKLVQEWIITNDDAKMKELRWYVMIMLMRSAK